MVELEKNNKGNIAIKEKLLKRYKNLSEIFEYIEKKFNNQLKININNDIKNKEYLKLKSQEMFKYAKMLFKNNHNVAEFYNNKDKIIVSNNDIKHTITFIYKTPGQKNILLQYPFVFSNLGDIIKHAKLISQTESNDKEKNEKSWHYYYDNLDIDGERYIIVFDVVSRNNGENHYRVQRLKKIDK